MARAVRVLLVQDSTGHSTGYHVIARGLRDAGIEVILGGALVPRGIAQLAAEESVDVIGYRIMDADPGILVEHLVSELRQRDVADIPLVVGGIVPDADLSRLRALGVAAIFRPGEATMDQISAAFNTLAATAHSGSRTA
jgi:methylmalonyl-CoA mutase C-terminal domain/subunit